MKAQIKSISAVDVDDLEAWQPGENFWVVIDLEIGEEAELGADLFSVTVCSPSGFADKMLTNTPIASANGCVLMERYDYQLLREWLEHWVEQAEDRSWERIAAKLTRVAYWEFGDYTPGQLDQELRLPPVP